MATPKRPDAILQRAADAIHDALRKGYKPPNIQLLRGEKGAIAIAAIAVGENRSTFQDHINEAQTKGLIDWGVYEGQNITKTEIDNNPFIFSSPFSAALIPSKSRSIEEIINHRRSESVRAREYEDATSLIRVDLKTPGPIGLFVLGDPHLENPGCDFELLEAHLKIAADRKEYIFAGNIGDLQDNWIGRLERLYVDTTVNSQEIWMLVEWMLRDCGVNWTWLVRGNHDKWLGRGDPVDWISKLGKIGVDQPDGVRLAFRHPNGAETRMHARHDFNGNSQFNPLHALKKEVLHGFRDHILVAGHRHIGADARDVNGDGMSFVMVRVSGFKVSDSYRHTLGLKAKPLHPAALIIVDPDEPDTSNNRVWVAPTVAEGADFLDFKRERFNSRARVTVKPKRRL